MPLNTTGCDFRFFTQTGTGLAPTATGTVPKTMNISKAGIDFIGKGYENPAEKGWDKKTGRYFSYDDGVGYTTNRLRSPDKAQRELC